MLWPIVPGYELSFLTYPNRQKSISVRTLRETHKKDVMKQSATTLLSYYLKNCLKYSAKTKSVVGTVHLNCYCNAACVYIWCFCDHNIRIV